VCLCSWYILHWKCDVPCMSLHRRNQDNGVWLTRMYVLYYTEWNQPAIRPVIIIIIIIIIFIIIIIIILVFTFMQGIYNYILERKHVSRVYSAAAVLYLQFVLHVMLFRQWNRFCTFILALSVVCVQCPIWLFFCNSLISCFPGMLLRNCLSDFEMVPVALLLLLFRDQNAVGWVGMTGPYYAHFM